MGYRYTIESNMLLSKNIIHKVSDIIALITKNRKGKDIIEYT
jgi:hypothetical protein